MKHDYTEFDKLLIAAIRAGKKRARDLEVELNGAAQQFRLKTKWGDGVPVFRIIDQRLQAQRRAGRIKFGRDGWHLVED